MMMAMGESGNSRRRQLGFLVTLLATILLGASTPAIAHKEHKKPPPAAEAILHPESRPSMSGIAAPSPMAEMADEHSKDRSGMSTGARLLDWLGRLHPIIVHFPIAFFPAALFTAIVGRRRPGFAAPVQFLVVAGGIIAPVAAVLGWFNAGFEPATDDGLLEVHRWLGTGIGFGALALGIWAWRRPDQLRGSATLAALTVITAAIIVQGWFGGAMVHGADHLNW
jgi:uncharacterized membrane protein